MAKYYSLGFRHRKNFNAPEEHKRIGFRCKDGYEYFSTDRVKVMAQFEIEDEKGNCPMMVE